MDEPSWITYDKTRYALYEHGGVLIIAARGTALDSDLWDPLEDVFVALLSIPSPCRTIEFGSIATHCQGLNRHRQILLTGHSLGGSVAMHVALTRGLEAHVFNPGAGLGGQGKVLVHELTHSKGGSVTVHRMAGDLVSMEIVHTPLVTVNDYVKTKSGWAHSLDHFL